MAGPVFEEGEVVVRNVRTDEEARDRKRDLASSMLGLGKNVFRLGKSMLALSISMIPKETAMHLRNGLRESIYAMASLPRDVVDVVGEKAEKYRQKYKQNSQQSHHDEAVETK